MELLYYLIFLFIGIALGALAVFFAMRSQVQAARERSTSTEQQMRDQQETFRQQMQAMQESQQQQMRDGRESLQQQLRSQQESQQQQMAQQMALLREQMSTTSERVLKERAAELSAVNSEQLSKILNPLQQNLQLRKCHLHQKHLRHQQNLQQMFEESHALESDIIAPEEIQHEPPEYGPVQRIKDGTFSAEILRYRATSANSS